MLLERRLEEKKPFFGRGRMLEMPVADKKKEILRHLPVPEIHQIHFVVENVNGEVWQNLKYTMTTAK